MSKDKRLSQLKGTTDKTDGSARGVRAERVRTVMLGGAGSSTDKKTVGVTRDAARGLGVKPRKRI